ncbi:putative transporter SEO1 [Lachnellula cervina]|uniref:Putative transporter SEO1 n=1 Tax=Lachnellula cervina TaxID=1316786 RepID=A0A7D8YPT7_9HELO|nr:putative transporter SEO1 [Lachnellula cervina]
MTIPVGIAGVFLWPGTPDKPNKWFLTPAEIELSRTRLSKGISKEASGAQLSTRQRLQHIFTDWKIYTLVLWGIIYWNINATSYGGYLLWLKSLKRYSTAKLNQYGSTSPAVGIFYVLFINFGSDLFLGRTGAITLSCIINIISLIILTIWNVPEAAKWVAFNMQYAQFGMSSVFYGWVNDILRNDPKERALTLVLVNAISQSTTAWIPLFTFPTSEGPKFRKGYSYSLAMSVVLILYTVLVIKPLHRRQERKQALESGSESPASEGSDRGKEGENVTVTPITIA